jgi:flavodoxin
MKASVVYVSRYGNTEKIAKALAKGLKLSGLEATTIHAGEADVNGLKELDLICVGGPTEWRSATKEMRVFLAKLKAAEPSGMFAFAFDTNLNRPLSGSAAGRIEKELKRAGLRTIAARQSAKVFLNNGTRNGAYLHEGEENRFEKIGERIGLALVGKKQLA